MNSVLRRVGLYSEAARSVVLLHVFAVVALVVSTVLSSIELWRFMNTGMFKALNGCKESGSPVFQETAYQPSAEYANCVAGVHVAAAIEAWLAVALLACAILALIVTVVMKFTDEYVRTRTGMPVYTDRLRAVRAGIGIAVILLVAVAVMVIFPVG